MTINRHNYEEYFLLYIDNELTVQERKAVEIFIKQNIDLQQEFDLLHDSILTEDPIIFIDKESLLKSESVPSYLQEKLLLLIDGELDKNENAKIAEQILNDAALKNEFELLKKTKLTTDNHIVFEHKNLLYKNEHSKLVVMRWRKIAVAAMLIGAGLWGTLGYFQKESASIFTETASGIPVNKSGTANKKSNVDIDKVSEKNDDGNIALNIQVQDENSFTKDTKIVASKMVTTKLVETSKPLNIEKQAVATLTIQPSNNLPKPYSESISNEQYNKNDVAGVTIAKKEMPNAMDNATNITGGNSIASNAVFSDNKKANNNITYGFDEDEATPKKNKVGGFLKKLSRVMQRNVKLKTNSEKSINVANLSFAIQ
jgi:hypothetical protein